MDLGPNEAQQILKRNAREFLEKACPTSHVRQMEEDAVGFDPAIWKQVCDFGWAGLLVPDQYGGSGGNLQDMVVLFEEVGRALLPGPLFASGVEAALTILELGSDAQKKALLPKLASGEKIYVLALTEPSGTYERWGIETKAEQQGGGWSISGTKLYIHLPNVADEMIVVARTGSEFTAFLVDPKQAGVKLTILDTIAHDHQYEVVLDNVQVGSDRVLGSVGGAWKGIENVIDKASVVLGGFAIGGAERSLELSIDYSKQRVQFGRPIGSFQALQHKMARMVTEVTGAQLLVYEAAFNLDNGLESSLVVPMAKAAACGAYTTCSIEGCHIFGGAGFIKDADIQLYYRRALGTELSLGDSRWQKKRVTAALAKQPAPAGH